MLYDFQLNLADPCNIPIINIIKLLPNFLIKKNMICCQNLKLYLWFGLRLKRIYCLLEFNQSQWLKQYNEFNTQKRIKAEKHGDKDGKALYKLMSNAIYGRIMKNLRNIVDVKFSSNKKDYLKWTSKPSYMSRKISDYDFSRDILKQSYINA